MEAQLGRKHACILINAKLNRQFKKGRSPRNFKKRGPRQVPHLPHPKPTIARKKDLPGWVSKIILLDRVNIFSTKVTQPNQSAIFLNRKSTSRNSTRYDSIANVYHF